MLKRATDVIASIKPRLLHQFMKKVKVQYMAGSEVREAELENVDHWEVESNEDNTMQSVRFFTATEHDNEVIAEFANCVAVMRV